MSSTDDYLLKMDGAIKRRLVKKGQILLRSGDEHRVSFQVRKGLLRSYIIDEKGKEHVFMFAPEGWIVGDLESHIFETQADLFIDALEDSEVDEIDVVAFGKPEDMPHDALVEQMQKLLRRVSVLQHRVIMLMSAPAVDRYREFVKTYPNITQRVPQRMVASYLGITPEALSKIRRELVKR